MNKDLDGIVSAKPSPQTARDNNRLRIYSETNVCLFKALQKDRNARSCEIARRSVRLTQVSYPSLMKSLTKNGYELEVGTVNCDGQLCDLPLTG
ncbi:MAG: hypothetical protein DMF09_05590 [Verrucomicrobia bacterium]|nr:MAG: hypothetical protein DMF09_05590 [Verrucomicrobiota bacterium]